MHTLTVIHDAVGSNAAIFNIWKKVTSILGCGTNVHLTLCLPNVGSIYHIIYKVCLRIIAHIHTVYNVQSSK